MMTKSTCLLLHDYPAAGGRLRDYVVDMGGRDKPAANVAANSERLK